MKKNFDELLALLLDLAHPHGVIKTQRTRANLLAVLRFSNGIISGKSPSIIGPDMRKTFNTIASRKIAKKRAKTSSLSNAENVALVSCLVPIAIDASIDPQSSLEVLLESAKILLTAVSQGIREVNEDNADDAKDAEPLYLALHLLCGRNKALDVDALTQNESERRLSAEVRSQTLNLVESQGGVFRVALQRLKKPEQMLLQASMQRAISERKKQAELSKHVLDDDYRTRQDSMRGTSTRSRRRRKEEEEEIKVMRNEKLASSQLSDFF